MLYLNKHLIYLNGNFSNVTDYQIKEGTVCIAETAFSGSTFVSKLTSVTLPDSLVRIGVRAFTYCVQLTNANIPSSVMYVGEDAFLNTALFKRDQTNYLDNWLLSYDAAGATEITLAENTVGIADGKVFSNYNSVTKVILPSSLKYIGESNFSSFSSLTSVTLSQDLVKIGSNAFYFCKKLAEFDLSVCGNLEIIEEYAFSFCQSMTRFHIPASVKVLGEGVFNQIPGVIVDFEIEEADKPAGFDESRDFTYAAQPVVANRGVSAI